MQTKARITACRHLETFHPGKAYIYKYDLLVSVMCEVWLLKSNADETDKEVTFVYVYGRWLKRLQVSVGPDALYWYIYLKFFSFVLTPLEFHLRIVGTYLYLYIFTPSLRVIVPKMQ